MRYLKNYQLFLEADVSTKTQAIMNQKVALEKRWNEYKSRKSSIPARVDNFLKMGDMSSITLQKDDLSKSSLKDLLTSNGDQTVNEYIMTYLLFIIEQRKKWQDTLADITKLQSDLKALTDLKPTDKEEIDSNNLKIKAIQDKITANNQLQSQYNKVVQDKERELETTYNKERSELETEINLSKNVDQKDAAEAALEKPTETPKS